MRALGILTALWCCAAVQAGVSVRDDSGHTVALERPAQRVVSLGPHLTELVFAAGGGAALKGVIRYSDFPLAAQRLPLVGDAFALDFETVKALEPDLVLVWDSGLNERHKARLRSLGLNLYVSEIRSAQGITESLRRLGVLLGTETQANAEATRLDAQWSELARRHSRQAPVRVFWQLWSEPLMTVNAEHLIGEAITACGGVNVFANLPLLTPTVSREAAVAADPQLIAAAGRAANTEDDFKAWRRFTRVSAVQHQQFALIDGDLIGRMGPRFVEGAGALCAAIDRAR